jgi:hypothetical protein
VTGSRHDRALLELLGGSAELLERLREAGLCPPEDEELGAAHADTARVVRVLAEELEVNWEGIEIIVRLRGELVATRRQIAQLLALLRGQTTGSG